MPTLKPTEAALRILKACTVEGNVVKLPPEELDRTLYQEVRKHLELIGGKWKGGKTSGFVFDDCETSYIEQLLDEQSNGEGRNLKKEYQFFPTPPELARRMMTLIKPLPGMDILEPSAGDGALIKELHACHGKDIVVSYCEAMDINRIKLGKLKNTIMVCEDFLDHSNDYQYDFIIANPPFTKGQDIEHIMKMYDLLKVNGRLVTIASPSYTFGSQKKQVAFKEFLQKVDAFQEELPAGTFSESGTEIRAMLIVIDKLEETPKSKMFIPGGFQQMEIPVVIEGVADLSDPPVSAPKTVSSKSNNMKKITVPASPLMAVLKKVKEVISKHSTLAILSNVLIKVRRSDIQVIATDLMVTIIYTIDVTNDGEYGYEYLLPFNFLYDVTNLINGMDLTIEIKTITKKEKGVVTSTDNAVLTTYCDTFNQDILDSPEGWPALPEFPQENSVGISGDFILWLNKAIDTVSDDDSRPAMQKIYIEIANEGLAIASTNASVVMEKTFPAESGKTAMLLVNTKIAKALKGLKETSISWSDTHIGFISNGLTMIGTIQDETFPNYKGVFPAEAPGTLTISLTELKGVMQKAALTKKPATLYFKREIGHIVIESFDEIYNRKVTVRIGADFAGECEQIIVDPKFLLLLLEQIDYSTITLSITGDKIPITITTESDKTYRSLTVPLVNS